MICTKMQVAINSRSVQRSTVANPEEDVPYGEGLDLGFMYEERVDGQPERSEFLYKSMKGEHMTKRFEELVDTLDYGELMKVKKDLNENKGLYLSKIINQKIAKRKAQHEKCCTVCSADLNPFSAHNYTLIFGPCDFRKKASFCGLDCLQYFIGKLDSLDKSSKQKIEGHYEHS